MIGDYTAQHRGAGNETVDPVMRVQDVVGAKSRHAGEMLGRDRNHYNNPFNRRMMGGLASSLKMLPWLEASDKQHSEALDGFEDSQVAQHPDGRFAANTAATSSHSRNALWDLLTRNIVATETTGVGLKHEETRSWKKDGSVKGVLYRDRALYTDPELMISKPAEGRLASVRRFFSGEWTVPQLILMTMGVYGSARLLM
jgi:hypothetical protein